MKHEAVNSVYPFLCAGCPINALPHYDAALSAARVDKAERLETGIGIPRTEAGILRRACRLARQRDECEDPGAVRGMEADMFNSFNSNGMPVTEEEYTDARLPITFDPSAAWPDTL